MRLNPLLVLAACLGAVTAAPVLAHLGQDQFGRFPFIVDDAVIGGGTSWGLVMPDEVFGGYGRVCEESFGPAVTFAIHQPARGRILVGGINGLEATSDGGCSYTVVDNALAGRFPNGLWQDPLDADHLLAGTSTTTGVNGVWHSRDGGDTWVEVIAERQGNFFSIVASDGGQRIAVGGNDGDPAGANVLLLVSVDGGATFVNVSSAVIERVIVAPLTWDGDDLILGGLDPSTQGFIDRVTLDGTTPIITAVGTTPRQTTHAVVFGGEVFTIARNGARGELYRENDSALGFGAVPDGPSECLFKEGNGLVGCGKQAGLNPAMFMTSTDGVTWTRVVSFVDVHYRACPDGTVGQTACASFLETFCGDDVDDDFDGLTDCEDDDCAFNPLCVAAEGEGEGEGEPGEGEGEGEGDVFPGTGSCCSGDPAAAAAGLGALLLRRRRRR